MKKVVGVFLILFISVLTFNKNVQATTGICYGEQMVDSTYCRLKAPITISLQKITEKLTFTDSSKYYLRYGFKGNVTGKTHRFFCIDSNLPAPHIPYAIARPFNISESDYDRAIAKVYSMYVNDSAYLMNTYDYSFERASEEYIQIANMVMRALTIKYNYDIKGDITRKNIYDNVYKQFEGKPVTGAKLNPGASFDLARKYYCSAVLSCEKCVEVKDAIAYCKTIETSQSKVINFKYNFTADSENIENVETDPTKFERIVPVKISGLELYTQLKSSYHKTNASFNITEIKCDNDKLKCTPVDPGLYTKNLADDNPGEEYIIKVRVSGDIENFKTETKSKILIKFKSNHILDIDSLAVLNYQVGGKQNNQRMIALMTDRIQDGNVSLAINTPTMCEVKREGNEYKYYIGGRELSERQYLESCSCDVEADRLNDEDAKEYFFEKCMTEDVVILDTKCDNDKNPNNISHSYVRQQSISKIMDIVDTAENLYNTPKFGKVNSHLEATDNNRDDIYLRNSSGKAISPKNDYCKMYTSEQLDIKYPGTAEATSGRFFIFDDDQQPVVDGKIYGNFHTDYTRWKNDYLNAIEAEKVAYTDWQIALAVENALAKAETEISCYSSGTCDCCNVSYVDGVPSCTGSCYTEYSGSDDRYADSNTYFTADGVDLKYIKASKSCGCDNDGTVSSTTSPKDSSSLLENTYNQAVRDREDLEKFKSECEMKSNLSSNWEYYLEPDLKFTYRQDYFDIEQNKKIKIQETKDLVISKKGEKYWPNVSTDVNVIPGSKTGGRVDESFTISYGAGRDGINETKLFDITKDYQLGYEQTLYYRSDDYYYGLLPDGNYITEVKNYQATNILDVGYVFNVKITNYTNRYWTWFSIENTGHLMQKPSVKPKKISNVQNSINKKLEKLNDPELKKVFSSENIDSTVFNNVCYYDNEAIVYRPECPTCEDFKPTYFNRTISNTNLFPNKGVKGRTVGPNWNNEKGKAAANDIQSKGDMAYSTENKEYSFRLTPTRMQEIKKTNKNSTYGDFNLICNEFGKECLSSFLTEIATESKTEDLLNNTRRHGWKYYVKKGNNYGWEKGSIKSTLSGNYPDADLNRNIWP